MKDCLELNLTSFEQFMESADVEIDDMDDNDLYAEMCYSYGNLLETYQEGELWDAAIGAGNDENIIIKILKFIPRFIIKLGKIMSTAIHNKRVELAARKIEKSAKNNANFHTESVSSKMITVDRVYFDKLENAVDTFVKYARNVPNIFAKLIKNTLKTGSFPYAKDFQEQLPIAWDFRKKQNLIVSSGEKISIDVIGPKLLKLKKKIEEAIKIYNSFETTFKKDWEQLVASLAMEVKNSKPMNAKAFVQRAIIPHFTLISAHASLISQSVGSAIIEVGDTEVVRESFYDELAEGSAIVEYMI